MKLDLSLSVFVVKNGNNLSLKILTDCPLYSRYKGLCSKCSFFKELTNEEGKCHITEIQKPIEEFKNPNSCPSEKERSIGGDCNRCKYFLGFANIYSFYCLAMER